MIRQYHSIQEYWMDTGDFLTRNSVKNNIIIGQCLVIPDQAAILDDYLLVNLYRSDRLILTAFKNHPNLVLAGDDFNQIDLLEFCEFIRMKDIIPQGVIAEKELSLSFAKAYGQKSVIHKALLAHQIGRLNPIALSEGSMELCVESDLNLVSEWLYNFQIECDLPYPKTRENTYEDAKRRIERKTIYKWMIHDQAVSICAEVMNNEYFSKISLVYTPLEYRKKNYARSCVWSLAKLIQERGQKTICLFTDKSNPTSNKIYSEIGFESVNEDCELRFVSP